MFGPTRDRRRLRRSPGVFPIAMRSPDCRPQTALPVFANPVRSPEGRPESALPVFAKLVVAAAAAIASACTASSSLAATRPLPAGSAFERASHARPVDRLAAVPAGWAAVPYRRAELSVPGGWMIEDAADGFFCPPRSAGMIFAGHGPRIPKKAGCRLTASYAWITPSGRPPARNQSPQADHGDQRPAGVPGDRRPAAQLSIWCPRSACGSARTARWPGEFWRR